MQIYILTFNIEASLCNVTCFLKDEVDVIGLFHLHFTFLKILRYITLEYIA